MSDLYKRIKEALNQPNMGNNTNMQNIGSEGEEDDEAIDINAGDIAQLARATGQNPAQLQRAMKNMSAGDAPVGQDAKAAGSLATTVVDAMTKDPSLLRKVKQTVQQQQNGRQQIKELFASFGELPTHPDKIVHRSGKEDTEKWEGNQPPNLKFVLHPEKLARRLGVEDSPNFNMSSFRRALYNLRNGQPLNPRELGQMGVAFIHLLELNYAETLRLLPFLRLYFRGQDDTVLDTEVPEEAPEEITNTIRENLKTYGRVKKL